MKKHSNLVVIVGRGGSGKTTIENELINKFGYTRVPSYTTRSPREGESLDSYIFVSDSDFDKLETEGKLIGSASFVVNDKELKYAFGKDMELHKNQKFVCIANMVSLKALIASDLNPTVFFIDTDKIECIDRMKERGDDPEVIAQRVVQDISDFDMTGFKEDDHTYGELTHTRAKRKLYEFRYYNPSEKAENIAFEIDTVMNERINK